MPGMNRSRILLAGMSAMVLLFPRPGHADGDPVDTWDPNPNASVNAVEVQADGKLLVSGNFTTIGGGSSVQLQRLTNEGVPDPDFFFNDSQFTVNAIFEQEDGKILIAGEYFDFMGPTVGRVDRLLPSGGFDNTFSSNTDTNVEILAVAAQADGKVLIGGEFTEFEGTARDRIARLDADGNLDATFNPGADDDVTGILPLADGRILVWGDFATIAGAARDFVAILNEDGTIDTSFDPPAFTGNRVLDCEVQPDGKILVGGDFTDIGGAARTGIARLNTDGSVDLGYDPGSDGGVLSIELQPDGAAIFGGNFSTTGGGTANNFARVDVDGNLDMDFAPVGTSSFVREVAIQPDGKIVVSGDFVSAEGVTRIYLARYNSDGSVEEELNPMSNNVSQVTALAIQPDGKTVITGAMNEVDGEVVNGIVRLNQNGSVDTDFAANASVGVPVNAIAIQEDGKIVLGGEFFGIGFEDQNDLGRLNGDGTVDVDFDPLIESDTMIVSNPEIEALAIQPDGKIIVGGHFHFVDSVRRNNIARLNADSSLDASFDPNADDEIRTVMVLENGQILIGGAFDNVGGSPQANLARLNSDGTLDTTFTPDIDGSIFTLAMHNDGRIYAGGFFDVVDGMEQEFICRLHMDGSFDMTYTPIIESLEIGAMAAQANGDLVMVGRFDMINGLTRDKIARVNKNGLADLDFASSANINVNYTALTPCGKIMIGGQFTSIDSESRPRFARLTNGSAVQSLDYMDNGTAVKWSRGGTSPDLISAKFEISSDNGMTWSALGAGSRISGTSDWELTGLVLPEQQNFLVRAMGRANTDSGGGVGGSLYETTKLMWIEDVIVPAPVVVDNSAAIAVLQRKIKRVKSAIKRARKSGNRNKIRRLKKKFRKFRVRLRLL